MNPNTLIAAFFAASLTTIHAATDLTNALNSYSGTSQDGFVAAIPGSIQPPFLTDTPASGLEVSFLATGFTAAAAWETIYFFPATPAPASPDFAGVEFGNNQANNNGRNFVRTVESNYNTQDFTALVTVRRAAPAAAPATTGGGRRSVFFGLGGGQRSGGNNPDFNTTNASVYIELQNGFDNASSRVQAAQTQTAGQTEIRYKKMTADNNDASPFAGSDESLRMRMEFKSEARQVIFSFDYNHIPGEAFVAQQTLQAIDVSAIDTQWADGDPARIFFGGDRNVVFTDLVIDVTAPPVPPAPTGLTLASVASNEVNLTWSSLAIPGTTYSVYRSTTSGIFTDPAIATGLTLKSYSDNTAVNGITYHYRITQSNTVAVALESAPSNEVSATPIGEAATPSGVIAVNGGKNAVVVDWPDLLSPFDTYTVRRSTSPGGPYSIPTGGSGLTESRFVDEAATDGTTYFYTVSATLGGNESIQSAEVSASSKPLEVFVDFNNGTPTYSGAGGLTTEPLGTAWNGIALGPVPNLADSSLALTSVGLNATGQGVFSKANGFGVGGDNATPGSQTLTVPGGYNLMQDYAFVNAAGTTTTYTLTGLIPGRKYDLYLYGYGDQIGQNTLFGASSTLKQTKNPEGLTTLTEGYHFVTFTTVAMEDGTVPFTWRNAFGTTDADANTGSAVIAGFQLVENAAAVLQPTDLFASGDTAAVGLTWLEINDATSYNIYRTTTPASGYSLLGSSITNSFSDTTATPGTTYYYVVKALNGAVESFYSGEVSGTRELPAIIDNDADGLSDADEALIGTNPNDPSDFFVAKASSVIRNGASYDVSFVIQGAQGNYIIERSTSLQAGSWTEVGTPVTWTWTGGVQDNLNLSASGLTPALGGKEFFRAKGVTAPAAP